MNDTQQTVADDLATLSFILADYHSDRGQVALACVKDEIARLEQERDELKEECADWERGADEELARAWKARAVAAEAEVARLQQLVAADEAWGARALLAEAEVARLKDGLRFYGDPATYEEGNEPHPTEFATYVTPIEFDKGERARALLAEDDREEALLARFAELDRRAAQ